MSWQKRFRRPSGSPQVSLPVAAAAYAIALVVQLAVLNLLG
jgi:hypothetical protein